MGSSWYHAAISIATICILAINGQEELGGRRCGCLEVPVNGPPRTEKFCRWKVTPSSLLYKQWHCVCRPGMVRNAWGDCITKHECKSCKCFWYKDFNVCGRDCPLKCGEPVRTTCSQDCAFGCDCPPGLIRTSSKSYCVKTSECTPICPANSRYTSCLSNCAPKCGKRQPPNCVTRCRRGGCACFEGYAEAEQGGVLICVPQQECYKYASASTPFPPTETDSVGGSGGSIGTSGQPSPPTIPVPSPETPVPPPGAAGSIPSGGPSHVTTGQGTGSGIAVSPHGPAPHSTPWSPPGGSGSTTPGLESPQVPHASPSQVTSTHQTETASSVSQNPPWQVIPQYPHNVSPNRSRPCIGCRPCIRCNTNGQPCRQC